MEAAFEESNHEEDLLSQMEISKNFTLDNLQGRMDKKTLSQIKEDELEKIAQEEMSN